MNIVDEKGSLNKYFADPKIFVPKAHLEKVCKCKQRGVCRYLGITINGFICAKNTPAKAHIDKAVLENKFTATADNCEGFGQLIE